MQFKRKFFSLVIAIVLPSIAFLGCTNVATSTTEARTSTNATSSKVETSTTTLANGETTVSSSVVTSKEASAFNYSDGIEPNGFWQGVKALDYVTLPKYMNISVPAADHTVSDQQIQNEIDKILNQESSTKQVTDRAIVDGDSVNIDYVGSINGVPFDGGSTKGTGADVTIGVTQYIDDFLQQLVGHKPGEKFDIKVTFPEDYGQSDLNGKEATFAITINYIIETVRPELTDAFVESHFASTKGWKTTAELKENIHKNLQETTSLVFLQKYIVDNAEIKEIPQAMFNYQENSMHAYFQGQAQAYGITLEELIQTAENVKTREELAEKYLERNTNSAKFNLIVQAIAEDAKISVSNEDVTRYFKEKLGLDDYTSYATEFGKPYLTQVVLINKVMDFLIDNAVLE